MSRPAPAAGSPVEIGSGERSGAHRAPPVTGRLGEVAAYAGAVIVAVAAATWVGRHWDALVRAGRIAMLSGLTVALAAVGLTCLLVRPRGRAALLRPEHGVRRRLASTALTFAAVSAAGTVALTASQQPAAAVTAAVGVAATELLAPSVLSAVAALGALGVLAGALLGAAHAAHAVTVVALAGVALAWALAVILLRRRPAGHS